MDWHVKSLLLPLLLGVTERVVAQAEESRIRGAFAEASAIVKADGGALWGRSLGGPMLIVNRATREVMASQEDREGYLEEIDGLYAGTLPPEVNAANTAMRWAGVHWTMVMAPLPGKKTDRARLLIHELFHRVQNDLGLPAQSPVNAHLDSYDGRLWLRLEMRALARALSSDGESLESAEAALSFRTCRRALCEGQSAAEEDALEINEGLCEYTGVRLSGLDDTEQRRHAAARLRGEEESDTLARSFAYATGPAYGLLLDDMDPEWRESVARVASLSAMLAEVLGYLEPDDLQEVAELHLEEYEGDAVRREEQRRRDRRARRRAEHLSRYIENSVLVLPLSQSVRYSFNPNQVEILDGHGEVHRTLRVTDVWGVLEVSGGALLLRKDGKVVEVRVPAPTEEDGAPIRGEGWTLTMKDEMRLVPGSRPSDRTVRGP